MVEERVRISGKWGRATDFVVDRVTVREELGPGGGSGAKSGHSRLGGMPHGPRCHPRNAFPSSTCTYSRSDAVVSVERLFKMGRKHESEIILGWPQVPWNKFCAVDPAELAQSASIGLARERAGF